MKTLKKLFRPVKLFIVLIVVVLIWVMIGIVDFVFDKETIQVDEVRIKI